jgi:hypothetical protein
VTADTPLFYNGPECFQKFRTIDLIKKNLLSSIASRKNVEELPGNLEP